MKGQGEISNSRGLYSSEIDAYMKKHPEYLGTVASDKISDLNPNGERNAFIVNLDKSNEPGSHWISLFISSRDDERSVEYFDSFGKDPPANISRGIKKFVDKMNTPTKLLMKINKVKHQFEDTASCGLHAINFLEKRIKGISFAEASGFINLKKLQMAKYEKEALKIEKRFKDYI